MIEDYIFAIAHEIRHIWQLRYHKNTYFVNYKPIHMSDSLTDTPTAKARWVLIYINFQIYSKAYKTDLFL